MVFCIIPSPNGEGVVAHCISGSQKLMKRGQYFKERGAISFQQTVKEVPAEKGPIALPGDLVALLFGQMIIPFAFKHVDQATSEDDTRRAVTIMPITIGDNFKRPEHEDELLSPVREPLSGKSDYYNAMSATGDGRECGFIYFLRYVPDTNPQRKSQFKRLRSDTSSDRAENKHNPTITEATLEEKPLTDIRNLDHTTPAPFSRLASCFSRLNGARTIFYQDETKCIRILRTDTLSDELIDITGKARAGTPLSAVSIVRDGVEAVYLYFAQTDDSLARVYWDSKTGFHDQLWVIRKNSDNIRIKSTMAVAPDANAEVNHIYYGTLKDIYVEVIDPW